MGKALRKAVVMVPIMRFVSDVLRGPVGLLLEGT